MKKKSWILPLLLSGLSISIARAQDPPASAQAAIRGSGTTNALAKFTGSQVIGTSVITETDGNLNTTGGITAGRIVGVTQSSEDAAMLGFNEGTAGSPTGVQGGASAGDTPIGVRGGAYNSSGNGIGVLGETNSPDATAGVFNNGAGGNIIVGMAFSSDQFRVDGTGRVFANGGFQPYGADFAESVAVKGRPAFYRPGDLLEVDPTGERRLALSRIPYSTLIAGVRSTKPGMLASPYPMDDPRLGQEVPLAVVGIVPCKVTAENGPINPGDLLVSSPTPGHAMRGTDRERMLGAVVGKALQPLQNGKGVIQILITLQ